VLFQGIAGTYCFNSAIPGRFTLLNGSVTCYTPMVNSPNTVVTFRDHPFAASFFVPTTSGIPAGTIYGSYNYSFAPDAAVATKFSWAMPVAGADCSAPAHIQLVCGGAAVAATDQTLGNGAANGYEWQDVVCGAPGGIGIMISTAAVGCSIYPANINFTVSLAATATDR
jgi:hypothetical protein